MRLATIIGCLMAGVGLSGCSSSQEWTFTPGQHAEGFDKEITKAIHYRFLLFLPGRFGQDPGHKWPLIIFLHGAGESGEDIEKVKMHGLPGLVEKDENFPFIVVSPQNPVGQRWDVEALNVLLDEVLGRLPVDKDRVYLTGLSRGGGGTWEFACAYPHRFAAIAPVCGRGYPDAACRLKDVPVWAFHGAKDDVIPVAESERMVEPLKQCGGDVRLTIYPDANHDAWTQTYANPELYKWFLEHKRK